MRDRQYSALLQGKRLGNLERWESVLQFAVATPDDEVFVRELLNRFLKRKTLPQGGHMARDLLALRLRASAVLTLGPEIET